MADRILHWYLPEVTGDGTNQGAAFCLDQSYTLPAKVRIHADIAPAGEDLEIDIKADGVSIFGNHNVLETKRDFVPSELSYNLLATSTFVEGGTISGGTSGASALITKVGSGFLELDLIGTTIFTAGETITGSPGSATAVVGKFAQGHTSTKSTIVSTGLKAVLPKGQNSDEYAESFASDKVLLDQYSWITLDVVKSGGAKKISVQLELNAEYQEDEPDDED